MSGSTTDFHSKKFSQRDSNMSGKGDKPRPMSVPRDEFNKKWDKIDWTKKKKPKKK